jgi:hexosaminidase
MRLAILTLFWLAGLVSTAQELKLIPYPRSVTRSAGELVLRGPVRIAVAGNSQEDRFAADLLVEELKTVHHLEAAVSPGAKAAILIGRAGDPRIDAEIARRKLDRAALAQEEGYVLEVDASGAFLASKTPAGVFYGVQTLRQLTASGGRVPAVRIADWPALRYRGFSIDLSRGPVLTDEQLETAIRTLAEYKYNMVFLYLEHVFGYAHSAFAAPPGATLTPDRARRLFALARKHHIELVPHQQLFGHLHTILRNELYADMGEIPHGSVLSPASERTYEWIKKATDELGSVFTGRFFSLGADETWELGEGQSRELAAKIGVSNVYRKHLERLFNMLFPMNKRFLFPGDIALKHPEMIGLLPKGLVAITWAYSPKDSYADYIEPFRKNGLEFFVCTTVHNWNRVFPNFADTRPNVNVFARDGKRAGALGIQVTEWRDDGEALFNPTWYGNVFSAAAAWQANDVDVDAFDRAFDWAFYRNTNGAYVRAIRNMEQAHTLLKSAGLGEANSRMFWTDPFTARGAAAVRKAYPIASKMRIGAEQAWLDLNRKGPPLHAGTIPSLRMAARRIDYLGMKIQFSKEIGDMYRATLADPDTYNTFRNNLRRIRGMDGLLPSLRDYASDVKGLYRDAWLLENHPYWMENVMALFDIEIQSWIRYMRLFDGAANEREATHKLPEIDKLGIVLP